MGKAYQTATMPAAFPSPGLILIHRHVRDAAVAGGFAWVFNGASDETPLEPSRTRSEKLPSLLCVPRAGLLDVTSRRSPERHGLQGKEHAELHIGATYVAVSLHRQEPEQLPQSLKNGDSPIWLWQRKPSKIQCPWHSNNCMADAEHNSHVSIRWQLTSITFTPDFLFTSPVVPFFITTDHIINITSSQGYGSQHS